MDAIVVGAGVIGITAALELQQRGLKVMLLDRQSVAQGCSFVSAGVIYPGAFPSSTYYRIPELPAAFFKASSSAALDWRSAPGLLSWCVQYARATRSDIVWHGTDLLHELCRDSLRSLELLLGSDLPPLSRCGHLAVHLSSCEVDRATCLNSIRTSLGAAVRIVSGGELAALEPAICRLALGPSAAGATFLAGAAHVTDTAAFVASLADVFVQRGGLLCFDRVQGLNSAGCGKVAVKCARGDYSPGTVVLATGAHSNRLLADCDHRIPLVAETGYHIELDVEPGFISRPVSLSGLGVILTPSERGARISGLIHFGLPGFRARPDLLLSALDRVRKSLPGLRARPGFEVRSGERPSTPDSLPVIERVPGHRSIFVSTGHGHLGLTLAAVSAGILADLVTNGSSSYESELSSQRFSRSTNSEAVLRAADQAAARLITRMCAPLCCGAVLKNLLAVHVSK
ncbi:D-amino-acid dehydrogenase [Paraburkholderia sp. HC6.4b]|uniref:NAD(P)/FAD-dependent oxidoreductase n=1 Tax=unclassified Paraburkholderia TaxID=2615204 RepID=UPI001614DE4D|nr:MULTISPECIES: FAD-dependent oxidoreductase [unclassified Paraburkholderia]MBB5411119.1 D-amino-acid dehydrogenase [Paraburkholderia sp. HC6.4b]MBB5453891.1 D-amino-acid dehydrogenase [Paraburkholderia sp. Kb1A]